MEELLNEQLSNVELLTSFQRTMLKTPKEKRSIGWFKTQLDDLEKQWTDFFKIHKKLLRAQDAFKDEMYFKEDLYSVTSVAYSQVKTLILGAINPGRNQSSMQGDSSYADVTMEGPSYRAPLPKIELPKFSGKQLEWETFKGMFNALVHDVPSIPPILKLQYLMLSLTGEAANRLKNLQVTADNYAGAWQAIQDKYDNKKVLLSTHMSNVVDCPPMNKKSVQELNRVLDIFRESKKAIDNLHIPAEKMGELWLTHHAVHKLDSATRLDWEREADKLKEYPSYKEMEAFLERYIRVLEAAKPPSTNISNSNLDSKPKSQSNAKGGKVSAHATDVQSKQNGSRTCPCCQEKHSIYACTKFENLSQPQRLAQCKKVKLCLNCLQKNHFSKDCPSTKSCLLCQGKRHTMLHSEGHDSSSSSDVNDTTAANFSARIASHKASIGETTLLATAQVILADARGNQVTVRALIDPGSERSFIKESVLSQLLPSISKTSLAVTAVGGGVSSRPRKEATLFLKSRVDKSFCIEIAPLILGKLTDLLPKAELKQREWPHIKNLVLADPTFFKPKDVECLLGAEVCPSLFLDGIIRGPIDTPIAQHTVFGWILTGKCTSKVSTHSATIQSFHISTEPTITSLVEKFWEVEDLSQEKPLKPDEQFCEDYFVKTTTRNTDGRFVVRLPFAKKPVFAGSRDIAVACLFRSERRLAKNPLLEKLYNDFMLEYLQLQHMEPVPRCQTSQDCFYLPHHGVFRPDNPNKIRVVFNASQQAANKISLNNVLLPGPKLQKDITVVLTRWRFLKFVFVTDIVKMFRQIFVHPDDRDWQRLVWRPTANQEIQDFRATTVTYGTAPAPFLALRAFQQLAEDGLESHPEAARILLDQTYVDDLFSGGDDLPSASRRRDQLIQLLASAGMALGKWSANEPSLLQGLAAEHADEFLVKVEEAVSTLGLKWSPREDNFAFKLSLSPNSIRVTKKSILSEVAKLFDPLGWLAPVLINAKIILQDLWIEKYDWDVPIQGELLHRWQQFRAALEDVPKIKIPRWIGSSERDSWQLHGFSDASNRAYAAAIYAVIPGKSSTLLMAKTKLAPIKVQTLPRLELCGATLLVRLAKHLLPKIQQQPDQIYFWSDSKVVLDWLKGHPSRWQVFVANRVSEICTSFPQATWSHVRSSHNAVDCATRGLTPQQLTESNLWWTGPTWLTLPPSEWPTGRALPNQDPEEEDEVIQAFVAQEAQGPNDEDDCLSCLQKFSSFAKIMRILAYCGRWRLNARLKREKRNLTFLTLQELAWAKTSYFRAIQRRHFDAELKCIEAKKPISKRSNLARLAPFLDKQQVIRIGGRLENAPLTFHERHPVVLPSNNTIVKRLVEETHRITLHGGVRLMLSQLGRSLWITRAKPLVTGVYRNCVICTRFNARVGEQQMAPLPAERLDFERPFATAGLDYAGPISVLFSKGRAAKVTKGYVLVIVCFAVKAVHIEIVSDLSTGAFMAAFYRFAARRGVPNTLYSDNATTFKGAKTKLDQMFTQYSAFSNKVAGQVAAEGTDWRFIPPRAPHFGGLWEAAVKSFKYHFKRIVGDTYLTFEEYSTLAARIEACLNSRPLCPLSTQPNDLTALTPGHFLNGSSGLSPPEPMEVPKKTSLLKHWQLVSHLRNLFWARFKKEALNQLQQRNKWLKPQPNLQLGDVVLLKDEPSPPTRWPLGLVIKLHPGKDGLVRVATIKTASSTFKRPIVKLVKLPIDVEATATYALYMLTKGNVSSNRSRRANSDYCRQIVR